MSITTFPLNEASPEEFKVVITADGVVNVPVNVGDANNANVPEVDGNETETALSADVFGNSTYSNKLAIYKSYNGVPANPLIGGDLSENKIGICTIEPISSLDVNGSFVISGVKYRRQYKNTV